MSVGRAFAYGCLVLLALLGASAARADIVLQGYQHIGDTASAAYTPRDPVQRSEMRAYPSRFHLSGNARITAVRLENLVRERSSESAKLWVYIDGTLRGMIEGNTSVIPLYAPLNLDAGIHTIAVDGACLSRENKPEDCKNGGQQSENDIGFSAITLVSPDNSTSINLNQRRHVGDSDDDSDWYHDHDAANQSWYPDATEGNTLSIPFTLQQSATLDQIQFYGVRDVDYERCILFFCWGPVSADVFVDGIRIGKLADGNITFTTNIALAPGTHTLAVASNAISSSDNDDVSWDDLILTFTPNVTPPLTPGAFNAFEDSLPGNAITGDIGTQIAGLGFPLRLVALNIAKTGLNTAFSGDVKVEILGSNTAPPLDANNCPIGATLLYGTTATFPTGRGYVTTSFPAVPEAWRHARVRISYPATGTPTLVSCSGDDFAIRPDHFAVTAMHQDWENAGNAESLNSTATSGLPKHKAGRPFALFAEARNALDGKTANYAGSTPLVNASNISLLTPAGGVLGAFDAGNWTTVTGVAQTLNATYSDVGAIRLAVGAITDSTFAQTDANDTNPVSDAARRTIFSANPLDIGRFVPDHFAISAGSIQNRTDAATLAGCANPFSYLDEQFDALFTITAQNAGNGTTQNYAGALAHLPFAVDNGNPADGEWGFGTSSAALASRVKHLGIQGTFSGGVAAVRSSLRMLRAGSAPGYTPDGPFPNTPITANPLDMDGVGVAAVTSIASTNLYFGRLAADNAYGSELAPLPMWAHTQYWDSASNAWRDMAGDTCTLFAIAPPAETALGQSSANDGRGYWSSLDYSSGNGRLHPPGGWLLWYTGAGPGGTFPIAFAGHSYLLGQPGIASFGRFQGNKRVIYWREVFN
ncbi:MAG: DUF6701 domain-containing protein [Pseudomonadota bacterium]